MSSRNQRLSSEERRAALVIHRALQRAREVFESGERQGAALAEEMRRVLGGEKLATLEYAEVVSTETLESVGEIDSEVLCAIAAVVGDTRLIDNTKLAPAAGEGDA